MMQYWPAPAKLNLFLHVLGKRADGYHDLQTVFQFLDYADTLAFETNQQGTIKRHASHPQIGEASDLCLLAAQALQAATQCQAGVTIHLRKRIPIGGGLGGGSSNAATTLLVLNRLWGLQLSVDELALIGSRLGADIPVFLSGHAAWAEGRGDQLKPIETQEKTYLVINPGVEISSRQIFQAVDLTAYSRPITIRGFHTGQTRNDLEPIACKMAPKVAQALEFLLGFGAARMTGSGACVFVAVENEQEGQRILNQCPETMTGFIARGINTHPILALLEGI